MEKAVAVGPFGTGHCVVWVVLPIFSVRRLNDVRL